MQWQPIANACQCHFYYYHYFYQSTFELHRYNICMLITSHNFFFLFLFALSIAISILFCEIRTKPILNLKFFSFFRILFLSTICIFAMRQKKHVFCSNYSIICKFNISCAHIRFTCRLSFFSLANSTMTMNILCGYQAKSCQFKAQLFTLVYMCIWTVINNFET